ncbi:DUF393 domain-containing protein [Streptomyces sp. NBC_00029]|uniref:DCC1-like thiol-disulfide oxidoreductase family protein n=1 Tax=Streptomyces sp. NBC_00029 TaxID=2903613 RepID=UPI00324E7E79
MNHHPILLFDGDCGFCAASVHLARTRVAPHVRFAPWQIADLDTLGVTEEQADHEILWITPETGIVQAGARAAARPAARAVRSSAAISSALSRSAWTRTSWVRTPPEMLPRSCAAPAWKTENLSEDGPITWKGGGPEVWKRPEA